VSRVEDPLALDASNCQWDSGIRLRVTTCLSAPANGLSALSGLGSVPVVLRPAPEGRFQPLAAVSGCSELSYETGQWSIRGLPPKSKTAWGHPAYRP
jgi:hypothetical protein